MRASWARRTRSSIQDAQTFLDQLPSSVPRKGESVSDGPWAALAKLDIEAEAELRHIIQLSNRLLSSSSGDIRNGTLRAVSELGTYPWPGGGIHWPLSTYENIGDLLSTHYAASDHEIEFESMERIVGLPHSDALDNMVRYWRIFEGCVDQLRSYTSPPVRPLLTTATGPLIGGGILPRQAVIMHSTLFGESLKHSRDLLGRTPLHVALYYDGADDIEEEDIRWDDVNVSDTMSFTPLHLAVIQNNLPFVEILLKGGAKYDTQGWAAMTPLHYAAMMGHEKVARRLLSEYREQGDHRGIAAGGVNDYTPADLALDQGHKDLYEYIMKFPSTFQF